VVEFIGTTSGTSTKPVPKEKSNRTMYTGTLIDDLIAAVERAEAKARQAETQEVEPWLAAIQESADYDSKLVEVA
jgi:hypothetical protein